MNSSLIYLDYAAATPLDPRVKQVMEPYYSDIYFNPSASYSKAVEAKRALNKYRSNIAQIIGAKTSEVIFCSGGSEANNLAIKGVMSSYSDSNIVVSSIEHDSVLKTSKRYSTKLCPVDPNGIIDLAKLSALIDDDTVIVSIMYVNNEIGSIEPISKISKIIASIRRDRLLRNIQKPIYLHTDACQATNYLDIHTSRLGVDLMTINSGKIYGPKQAGILFVKAGVKIQPLIDGGGQEHGFRSGTENLAAIAGINEAIKIAQENRKEEANRLEILKKEFIESLLNINPNININGSIKHRIANNVHFSIPNKDNEAILFKLDSNGIMAAAGSACSASSQEPSHVLKAIGISDELTRSSIRMTFGRKTTKDQLDKTLNLLSNII